MRTLREYLIEKLADQERAIGYLQAILEDYQIFENSAVVLRALETVVEAQGGVAKVAKQIGMDPQILSKALSNDDTPLVDALGVVLKALGYQLSIKPVAREDPNLETDTDELEVQNASAHVSESPTSLQ
jgi:probable addiction module antidote protein